MSAGIDYGHIFEILVGASPVAVAAYIAIKVDNAVLKTRMSAVDKKMDVTDRKIDRIDGVLVTLAEQKGRMDRMDDRQVMSGARLDELAKRVNDWIDAGRPQHP